MKHQADVGDVVELEMLTPDAAERAAQPHADLARQLAADLTTDLATEEFSNGAGLQSSSLGAGWRTSGAPSQSDDDGTWEDAFSNGLAA